MSSRYWSCEQDRKFLNILHKTTTAMYSYAEYVTSSGDEYTDSDVGKFLVPTVLTLGKIDQFLEVNKVCEDHHHSLH